MTVNRAVGLAPTLLRKGTASIFNMAITEAATYRCSIAITIAVFFAYSFGTDLLLGRCPGMMIAGSRWIGEPTWVQKFIYSSSYSLCFAMLFCGLFPFIAVTCAQVLAIAATGKTTHGLLARMDSEYWVKC